MKRQSRVLLGAGLILMVAAIGVTQTSSGNFRGETTVNVIEVPVRVIDPETGESVHGLSRDDFRILEGDAAQEITNFSEISRAVAAGEQPRDEGDMPAPAATQELDERPLEVVYFFDLFLALKGDKVRAVRALREAYRSQVPDDEQVSIVVFDGELEVLLDRADDNFDVLDVLDEVEEIKARGVQQYVSFTGALSEEASSGQRDLEFYERRQRNREYFFEMEKRVKRVGSALQATMARYATADARRVVVAFTPGYPGANWAPTYSPIDFINNAAQYPAQELWKDVALEAADLGFTLFVVDSSGLRASTASDAEIGVTDSIGEIFAQGEVFGSANDARRQEPEVTEDNFDRFDPNAREGSLGGWLERTRKNLLINAASTTGGEAIFDENVGRAMTEVNKTLEHYYSLAYTAEHVGDGQVYDIGVELVGHPEYELVHRTAYVDQPTSIRQAQRLRSAMLFGGDANPLGIQIELGEIDSRFRLGAAGSKRVQVPFEIRIPYARVEMIPRGAVRWGKLLITFFAEDEGGNQSQLASNEQPITVASDRYEEAVAKGYFSYKTTVEVEGGEQKIYLGIQDLVSGKISIMPQTFDF